MLAGMWRLELTSKGGHTVVAPLSYILADEYEIAEKTGGCGPGKIGDWFVPDTMYGESVFIACQIHDWMYGEGETSEDKKVADIVFLVNMTLLVVEDNEVLDVLRLRRVMTYFEAVFFGGKDAFDKGETMRRN